MVPLDTTQCWQWSLEDEAESILSLPSGTLRARRVIGEGLRATDEPVQVCWRQGGERIRPVGRDGSQALKKLLQQAGVPPWQRERLPLLYVGEVLVAVADLWLAEGWQAGPDEAGWLFDWRP